MPDRARFRSFTPLRSVPLLNRKPPAPKERVERNIFVYFACLLDKGGTYRPLSSFVNSFESSFELLPVINSDTFSSRRERHAICQSLTIWTSSRKTYSLPVFGIRALTYSDSVCASGIADENSSFSKLTLRTASPRALNSSAICARITDLPHLRIPVITLIRSLSKNGRIGSI